MHEKVINSRKDLEFLLLHPNLLRNSITIIEPWEHVGVNQNGEDVRASKNIAYIAQKVADMDSVLLPVWSTGVIDPEIVIPAITSGYAVVVEKGDPSTYDASTKDLSGLSARRYVCISGKVTNFAIA